MKKLLSVILSVLIITVCLCSCSKAPSSDVETPTYSLSEIVDKIYEKYPVQLMMLTSTELDMNAANSSDTAEKEAFMDNLKYFTGLTDASGIKGVLSSEPGISSQAYSLVLVRVENAANAKSVAQQMLNGIDTRKWFCVMADKLRVCVKGDTIMLVMFDSVLEYSDEEIANAFSDVMGGIDENLTK